MLHKFSENVLLLTASFVIVSCKPVESGTSQSSEYLRSNVQESNVSINDNYHQRSVHACNDKLTTYQYNYPLTTPNFYSNPIKNPPNPQHGYGDNIAIVTHSDNFTREAVKRSEDYYKDIQQNRPDAALVSLSKLVDLFADLHLQIPKRDSSSQIDPLYGSYVRFLTEQATSSYAKFGRVEFITKTYEAIKKSPYTAIEFDSIRRINSSLSQNIDESIMDILSNYEFFVLNEAINGNIQKSIFLEQRAQEMIILSYRIPWPKPRFIPNNDGFCSLDQLFSIRIYAVFVAWEISNRKRLTRSSDPALSIEPPNVYDSRMTKILDHLNSTRR
jgi:hypothetical protein